MQCTYPISCLMPRDSYGAFGTLIRGLCCRYYDLDAYHRHQLEKEMKKGFKKVGETERTVFNDEEQRRYVVPVYLFTFDGVLFLWKYVSCFFQHL